MRSTVYLLALLAVLMMMLTACDEKSTKVSVVSAPVISPESGTYESGTAITITCPTDDAEIRYTINGSDPTDTSEEYLIPLYIPTIFTIGANSGTVKARAFKEGMEPSPIVTVNYAINYAEQVARPVIAPNADSLVIGDTVTMTCTTPGSQIRYTLDGSEPTIFSSTYSTPVPVLRTGNVEVKAVAFRASMNPSPVETKVYNVTYTAPLMVDVPAGSFTYLGTNITLSGFKMAPYEISQVGYAAVMAKTPSSFTGDIQAPVERVSWFNAIEYCNRRSIQENLSPCYNYSTYGTNPDDWPEGWDQSKNNHESVTCDFTANGYRLPTETEFLYAANAAADTLTTTYSGGNTIENVAWYAGNSTAKTHAVGTKTANALGIYDLSGNVWEWCWDIYSATYPGDQTNNPSGPTSGSFRVFRGGSWASSAPNCWIITRSWGGAPVQYSDLGFRVVRKQ